MSTHAMVGFDLDESVTRAERERVYDWLASWGMSRWDFEHGKTITLPNTTVKGLTELGATAAEVGDRAHAGIVRIVGDRVTRLYVCIITDSYAWDKATANRFGSMFAAAQPQEPTGPLAGLGSIAFGRK